MTGNLSEKVKRLDVVDIGLVKLGVFFTTIIIVKLIPQLLNIGYLLLIVLVVVFSFRPFYKCWIKK